MGVFHEDVGNQKVRAIPLPTHQVPQTERIGNRGIIQYQRRRVVAHPTVVGNGDWENQSRQSVVMTFLVLSPQVAPVLPVA